MLVIPHFGPGGAQHVATLLLNHWHHAGIRLAALTLFPQPETHELTPDIPRYQFLPTAGRRRTVNLLETAFFKVRDILAAQQVGGNTPIAVLCEAGIRTLDGIRSARALILTRLMPRRYSIRSQRIHWLRQHIQDLRPRVVVSFVGSTNIQTLLAARGLDVKVIISERNDPALQTLDRPWEELRDTVYAEADFVTANSAGAVNTMAAYVPREKLRLLPNPVSIPEPTTAYHREQRIVFLARLVSQKRANVLLDAYSLLTGNAANWRLDIIGDGPNRRQLEAQARQLGIAERVTFHGHISNPYPLLYRAQIFVLPSSFEGMPNAMLEAMYCSLAVIVSDASPGPLEIVVPGETGLIFPLDDAEQLAQAIVKLTDDMALRQHLSSNAKHVVDSMTLPKVSSLWMDLFRQVGADFSK